MTTASDHHPLPDPAATSEPAGRSGSIVLVLVVAGAIVAAALGFMMLGKAQAQPYIVALLALLAMVGLFTLFAFAAGIVRLADRAADSPMMRPVVDHSFDGLAVTDARGHVVEQGQALRLGGAQGRLLPQLCSMAGCAARQEAGEGEDPRPPPPSPRRSRRHRLTPKHVKLPRSSSFGSAICSQERRCSPYVRVTRRRPASATGRRRGPGSAGAPGSAT